MTAVVGSQRWFTRPVPSDAEALLVGFPYTGMGASTYADWPSRIGPMAVVALQPPGREGRLREPAHRTHAAFADDATAALRPYLGRPYVLAAHCGGVPYALETLRSLMADGQPPPRALLLSSWGAPHLGLYGRLNHVDLATLDPVAEVIAVARQMGRELPEDLAELVSEALSEDLEIQRDYRYSSGFPLPCPVRVVAWSRDDVVPAAEVRPGWASYGDVRYVELEGDHRAFLACPAALRQRILDDLAG